jgi:2-hydroxychromene-2-carboxylate isomerase
VAGPAIDFYFACASPWSYLATERLHAIAAAHGRTVAYRPVDVGRAWSTTGGGRPMGQRPRVALDYRLVELPRWRAFRNVRLNVEPAHFPVDHWLSSRVITAARLAGADVHLLTLALMQGCWADERDIADPGTVSEIADAAGFDGKALLVESRNAAIAADTDALMAAGGWSVPSIVVDNELFFGQDRLELIEWRLAGGRNA